MRGLLTFLLLCTLGFAGWLAWALWLPMSPGGQKFVMLRSGYSTRHVARELKSAGVIRNSEAFVLWHAFHRRPSLKAGEYLFDRDENAIAIHKRLARGDVYVHTVVIPEGCNMFEIAAAIESAGVGARTEVLKAGMADTALIGDLAAQAEALDGYRF